MSKKKIRRKQAYRPAKAKKRTLRERWGGLPAREKKGALIACLAVLAALVLGLGYYFFLYDDGSLPVKGGQAVGAQENWLIGERAKGRNSAFYHFADVETPAGYTEGTTTLNGIAATVRTDFSFVNDEGVSLYVASIYDSAKKVAQEKRDIVESSLQSLGTVSEVGRLSGPLGVTYYYVFSYRFTDQANGAENALQSLVSYTPTRFKDASILVTVSRTPTGEDDFWDAEALLAELRSAQAAITLIH